MENVDVLLQNLDSEDEKERHEGGQDVFVSRPNPLEPQPKKKIKIV